MLMMKAIYRIYILLVAVLFCGGTAVIAADLPVLPVPQYAQRGNPMDIMSVQISFSMIGVDADAATRLRDQWTRFRPFTRLADTATSMAVLGILGKDAALDSKVAAMD